LGIHEEPQLVKLNIDLDSSIINVREELFKEYKDKNIFTWTYKDLKGIPPHLMQHQIKLYTNIPASHQAQYRMNWNYVAVVKQDLDKLLATRFIVPMEEGT
jgi:hypothetical protein